MPIWLIGTLVVLVWAAPFVLDGLDLVQVPGRRDDPRYRVVSAPGHHRQLHPGVRVPGRPLGDQQHRPGGRVDFPLRHLRGDGRLRPRAAPVPGAGRDLRRVPRLADDPGRGLRHPHAPRLHQGRLGEQLPGPHPPHHRQRLQRLHLPAVLPRVPGRARGGGANGRGGAVPPLLERRVSRSRAPR